MEGPPGPACPPGKTAADHSMACVIGTIDFFLFLIMTFSESFKSTDKNAKHMKTVKWSPATSHHGKRHLNTSSSDVLPPAEGSEPQEQSLQWAGWQACLACAVRTVGPAAPLLGSSLAKMLTGLCQDLCGSTVCKSRKLETTQEAIKKRLVRSTMGLLDRP